MSCQPLSNIMEMLIELSMGILLPLIEKQPVR